MLEGSAFQAIGQIMESLENGNLIKDFILNLSPLMDDKNR